MLNYIWAFMIVVGIVYAMMTGNMEAVSNGFLNSSKEAVTMCVTMLGVISFWMGIMEIGRKAGVTQQLTRLVSPLVNFMFPHIPKKHRSREYITTNMIANILGLGWAATPPGLKAMEELARLEEERENADESKSSHTVAQAREASDEMCTFLVLNISSLQLIPINIIAYRSQYGSVNPAAVVAPAIMATTVSTVVGIFFCKMMTCNRRKEKRNKGIKKSG